MRSGQRAGVWVSCPKRPLVAWGGCDSLLPLFCFPVRVGVPSVVFQLLAGPVTISGKGSGFHLLLLPLAIGVGFEGKQGRGRTNVLVGFTEGKQLFPMGLTGNARGRT